MNTVSMLESNKLINLNCLLPYLFTGIRLGVFPDELESEFYPPTVSQPLTEHQISEEGTAFEMFSSSSSNSDVVSY